MQRLIASQSGAIFKLQSMRNNEFGLVDLAFEGTRGCHGRAERNRQNERHEKETKKLQQSVM